MGKGIRGEGKRNKRGVVEAGRGKGGFEMMTS